MKKPYFLTIKISFVETMESWLTGIGLGFLVLGILGLVVFFRQTKDTFYQGIYVDNVSLSGLTKQQAQELLEFNLQQKIVEVSVSVDDITVSSTSAQLEITKDYTQPLADAFEVGRSGFPLTRLATIFSLTLNPQKFTSKYTVDETKVESLLNNLSQRAFIFGENPRAYLNVSGVANSIVVHKGNIGREVDQLQTKKLLLNTVQNTTLESKVQVEASVASTAAQLNETQIAAAINRASNFVGKKVVFSADERSLTLNDQQLISLLSLPQGTVSDVSEIIEKWQAQVNREPQEPVFSFNPQTLAVETFVPPRDGLTLDATKTKQSIMQSIEDIETLSQFETSETETIKDTFEYDLPMAAKAPKKLLASTNNLGIAERIGFGDSEYDHSIPTRIHNVSLASEKINNIIIAPGEEFSFNKELGEVSKSTGFQPAYVISGGKTILGDGGGVCQVSTTLFRSILDAGLLVTKRRQHSYRVSYYELNQKPGIDATVYSGDVDLRFKNDTQDHILIHTNADPTKLYITIELYGTSDGRQTEIVDHQVWDYRSAPPPIYSDDPSLPPGVVKQVDWAVSGVKAKFTKVIKDKDGNEIRKDEYYSNYIPWSAKYIRGI
jgi:vancomycin resistance protein YoaR